jgi:murein L,D-transpeptidase YafK
MTPGAVIAHGADEWAQFWANLRQGYDAFETTRVPPAVFACGKRYAFGTQGRSTCARVAAW